MDLQTYNDKLSEAKSSSKPSDIIISKAPVISELGEEIYPGKVEVITPKFTRIPYRTPLDLKGYDEGQIFTEPSMVDMTGYVDNREMIARLMKTLPARALEKIYEQQADDKDYTSDANLSNDDYEQFDESDEPLDNLTYIAGQQQQGVQNVDKAEPKQAQASADEDERSEDEDK